MERTRSRQVGAWTRPERDEDERLQTLDSYQIMDAEPEDRFDALTRAAVDVAGVPTALISLLDADRQWFLSRQEMEPAETPRELALCDHVVRSRAELVINDTTADARFADNPLVTGDPGIRFYAGFPLLTPSGQILGTLCVIGYAPGSLTEVQARLLRTLADQVMAQLDLRRQLLDREGQIRRLTRLRVAEATAAKQLVDARREARTDRDLLTAVLDAVDVGIVAADANGRLSVVNHAARSFHVSEPGAPSTDWLRDVDAYLPDGDTPLTAADRPLARALTAPPGEGAVDGATIALGRAGPDRTLIRVNVRQLLDPAGAVTGAVAALTDITAATHAERELMTARERAEQIVATATDAYMRLDSDGRILEWNPAVTVLFGWAAGDAVGRNLAELLTDPEETPRYSERLDRFLQQGAGNQHGARIDLVAVHRDNRPVPVELMIWPTADGEECRFNVFLRDISERAQAAHLLAEAHEQLIQALDAMPRSVTLVSVDRDAVGEPVALRVRWINAHVRALIGLDQDQVVDRPFADVFPAAAALYEQTYLDVARTGQPLHLPIDWYSGETISGAFDVTVVPWTGDGLLSDTADVTARRNAERALEGSERRLREAQVLAGLGAWEWDIAAGTVDWSPLMFDLLGVDPKVTPGPAMMLDLIHPDEREAFIQHVNNTTRTGDSTTVDFRVQRPDGRTIWIRAYATVECDEAGNAIRAWGTDQDITPRGRRRTSCPKPPTPIR